MMTKLLKTAPLPEITHELPDNPTSRYPNNGEYLFTAFGCALYECLSEKYYVYKAVNLENGKSTVICRKKTPLTTSGVTAMTEKIRVSSVAGRDILDIERNFGESVSYTNLKDVMQTIFGAILPQYGYTIREKQIELANHILEDISKRRVSLAEAEVGTGKTHAYLIAAILAKRGRLNGFWNMGYYPKMQYVDMANMPVVISTSSIALQNAIIRDYIPELSKILTDNGVINDPLTAVIRKGKEHYICDYNLRTYTDSESNMMNKKILDELLQSGAACDLDEIDGLAPQVKRKINVPIRCDINCPYYGDCRYMRFMEQAQSPAIDFQIVNHNYLLADTLLRAGGKGSLIPNYQMIIVDEGHKFLNAARQIYGLSFSSREMSEILADVKNIHIQERDAQKMIREIAKKLTILSAAFFDRLDEQIVLDEGEDDTERFPVNISAETETCLNGIRKGMNRLGNLLTENEAFGEGGGKRSRVLWRLKHITEQITALEKRNDLILWLEKSDEKVKSVLGAEIRLCAIPKDIDVRLYKDLWSKGFPVILTSGTLSAGWLMPSTPAYLRGRGGDFTRIKRTLGIDRVEIRQSETSKPSPFDYKKKALLYISETMPFPDNRDNHYIESVTNEITKLVDASHGHAAVLFTSYKAMDKVWERLTARTLPFPMYRLDRGGVNAIDRFKKSGSGVLFASGSMWEGIDIPGDALSMLIIVKLPFTVPDPIGNYEQTLYGNMYEYKQRVIVPEMLIKLKQGFGRLIRTESDTGVVAILDSRVNEKGAYRKRVLDALPDCRVTSKMISVEQFFKAKKASGYFG